ncbi:hypothetical protein D3C79_837260 [compost metagenome]
MLVALLFDVDVRLQQAADILDGDPVHYHGEALTSEGIALLFGLVLQRQQPLLTRKLGPGLQALGLLHQIPLWRKQHPAGLGERGQHVLAGRLQDDGAPGAPDHDDEGRAIQQGQQAAPVPPLGDGHGEQRQHQAEHAHGQRPNSTRMRWATLSSGRDSLAMPALATAWGMP